MKTLAYELQEIRKQKCSGVISLQTAPAPPLEGEVLVWVTKTTVTNSLCYFCLPGVAEEVRKAASPGAARLGFSCSRFHCQMCTYERGRYNLHVFSSYVLWLVLKTERKGRRNRGGGAVPCSAGLYRTVL